MQEGYVTIDAAELKRLQADSAELARMRAAVSMEVVAHVDGSDREDWFIEVEDASELCDDGMLYRDCQLVRLCDAHSAIAQARQAPEGFVLVPVEPTPEMLAAIVREADKQESYWAYKPDQFYRAMLAAAPKGDSHE